MLFLADSRSNSLYLFLQAVTPPSLCLSLFSSICFDWLHSEANETLKPAGDVQAIYIFIDF